MCRFVDVVEKIKSSSVESVANKEFSDFNRYMHIPTEMDNELETAVKRAVDYPKALILVCGNSGDGKSHLIGKMMADGIIKETEFDVYIDATSSDRKGLFANDKLKEKLIPFQDDSIDNGEPYRLIVAINLGVLNDFLKKNQGEFQILAAYIENNRLFDNLPTWKEIEIEKNRQERQEGSFLISHVDFTEYHRYSLSSDGVGTEFVNELLSKIIGKTDDNDIYKSFVHICENCDTKTNCPVYHNYLFLSVNVAAQNYLISLLVKAIIKNGLIPSVREINDFFYECIVGNSFEKCQNNVKSIERLKHFIHNNLFWNMFENPTGLLKFVGLEDILNSTHQIIDEKLIRLNLTPSFDTWLSQIATEEEGIFSQIESDIRYCSSNQAKKYSEAKEEIKRDIFKLYLRFCAMKEEEDDDDYSNFIKYLYYYNTGNVDECENIYDLAIKCFYRWNGRLINNEAKEIDNAVIISGNSEKYCLYKVVELEFVPEREMVPIDSGQAYWKFSNSVKLCFKVQRSEEIFAIDIDYDLYSFMLKVDRGYQPTSFDRRARVKFDSFVRNIASIADGEIHIFSYLDGGHRYRIKKNFIGKYIFEEER